MGIQLQKNEIKTAISSTNVPIICEMTCNEKLRNATEAGLMS